MHVNSDSITNEFSVEINLIGSELDPDQITAILGLEPVKIARAGEPRCNGKEDSFHEHGFWAYETTSHDEVNECRDHQLICLAESIEPHIEKLRSAGVERIYFYFTLSSVFGLLNIRFKAETLELLGRIGADLYVSCYDCFNPNHPIWRQPSMAEAASAPADGKA